MFDFRVTGSAPMLSTESFRQSWAVRGQSLKPIVLISIYTLGVRCLTNRSDRFAKNRNNEHKVH